MAGWRTRQGNNSSKESRPVRRLTVKKTHTVIRRVQLGVANPATDPPAPEKTDPAKAGTKAGSEIIKAATIGENPTGHRLFLQVRQDNDGWRVELHGACGGYLLTIVRGLNLNNAVMRAEIEAEARGIEVRP